MKKNLVYLLSFLSVATVASCTKELVEPEEVASSAKKTTITITLDPSTRTSLSEGKTYWTTGDKILVTDGTQKDTVVIPTADNGSSTATVTTSLSASKLYAVYPASAFKSVTDGKINIKIPTDQSGIFSDANISAAVSSNQQLLMKNATSVMKITTSEDALYVVLNAVGTTISGAMTVEFAEDGSIASTTPSGSTGVITMEAPTADDYYVAVAPGTYNAGFSVMAINPADGTFESKASKTANTIPVNGMVDLGSIGDNLSGFDGSGTEADPIRVSSLGEMIAFANCVNAGKDFAGQYVKLMNNVSGLTTPIGCYNPAAEEDYRDRYFKGDFNGNGKTVTIDLNGSSSKSPDYLALFGEVGEGAHIHDIIVDGSVTTTGGCAAGVVGCLNAGSGATLSNCTNKATVSGAFRAGGIVGYVDADQVTGSDPFVMTISNCNNSGKVTSSSYQVGGIAGYASWTTFDNCKNTGSVTATHSNGGIVGYGFYLSVLSCSNSGSVVGSASCGRYLGLPAGNWRFSALDGTDDQGNYTLTSISTKGVGGLVGYAQNVAAKLSSNKGSVTGVNKVGGVFGTAYWSSTNTCSNSGVIKGSDTAVGGIYGWIYVQSSSYYDTNNGSITGKALVGGIVGFSNSATSAASINIRYCKNTAPIHATGGQAISEYNHTWNNVSAAGGIVGGARELANGSKYGITCVLSCENSGSVTGDGIAAGGIMGYSTHPLNSVNTGYIKKCINSGSVKSLTHVGGVAGIVFHRFTSSLIQVVDNENNGSVLSTSTSASSLYAGGIVGWCSSLWPVDKYKDDGTVQKDGAFTKIYNNLNNGSVSYSSPSAAYPYVGGIVGYMAQTDFANNYNGGEVKLVSGTPAEGSDSYIGACVGRVNLQTSFRYAYYLTGTYSKAVGSFNDKFPLEASISAVEATGDLATTLTLYGDDYSLAVNALNAFVNKNSSDSYTYYTWVDGPAFKKD